VPHSLGCCAPCARVSELINQVVGLASSLTALEQLHLAENGISELSTPALDAFSNLRELSLQGNRLSSWASVRDSLSHLPLCVSPPSLVDLTGSRC